MNKEENKKYWTLVLGASSGFGGATAMKLAEDGYNVIGVHLDRQATMPNVEKIINHIKSCDREAIFYNVNAADQFKRNEIVTELKSKLNGQPVIKIIMHSLAFGTLKSFVPRKSDEQPITHAQMEMTLDVMAHSLVYWVQAIYLAGLLAKKGRIFAMTSSGSHSAIPYYGAVSAAKAALESHIRQLTVELGHMDIGATAIMAGVTDTPALRKIPGNTEMIDIALKKNPRNRLTTTQDVAKIISLLCKEGGEWISGGMINADGGEDIVSYTGKRN